MKYILLSTLLLFAGAAQAQERCVETQTGQKVLLDQFGENRVLTGIVDDKTSFEFWMNPTTLSWSLVLVSGTTSCLMAAGSGVSFLPITQPPNL